ncbi:MAG: hypothetical protein JKY65_05040 [Planctomycetes bacterium]|nr:hypothetical protein [Planctomycetota bacterium]
MVRALALLTVVACSASADELVLASGEVLQGRLLAAGPSRILVEEKIGSARFLARSQISAYRVQGQPKTLPEEALDPTALVKVVKGSVRVRRQGQELGVSLSGPAGILREGDELRTGPFGKVAFHLPSGGEGRAWHDAVVRFTGGIPALAAGKLQVTHLEGRVLASFPGGRVDVVRGKLEATLLQGQTRLQCLRGRAQVRGTQGYLLDIPRTHAATVIAESRDAPASVSASNTNAWRLRLELNKRRITIRPGERVILLAPVVVQAEPVRPRPTPAVVPQEKPLPPPSELVKKDGPVGSVIRASSAFALSRRALPARRVEQAECEGLELRSGDRLDTSAGDLSLRFGTARVDLSKESRGVVGSGGVPFRLLAGQALVQSERETSLAFPEGEIGLLSGSAVIRQEGGTTHLGVTRGIAGARIGERVRAELLGPSELHIQRGTNGIELRAPATGSTIPLVLGGLELRLRAGESLRFSHAGGTEQVTLRPGATQTRIELSGVRAKIRPGANESRILHLLHDGRQVILGPGTYRFIRRGKEVLAYLPGQIPERTLAAGTPTPSGAGASRAQPAPVRPSVAGGPIVPARQKTLTGHRQLLANGAVVVLHNWGPLVVKRAWRREGDRAHMIAIEGPRGELQLEPKSVIHLERLVGVAKVATPDGRFVLHHPGGSSFTALVRANGVLAIQVAEGDRSVEIEAGVEFDMSLRPDRYVLTYVFGQAVYLEPRQQMRVTRKDGLRMRYARNRGKARSSKTKPAPKGAGGNK